MTCLRRSGSRINTVHARTRPRPRKWFRLNVTNCKMPHRHIGAISKWHQEEQVSFYSMPRSHLRGFSTRLTDISNAQVTAYRNKSPLSLYRPL